MTQHSRFLSSEHSTTLTLAAGTVIRCVAGRMWLTLECRALPGPSPDIVLMPGQQHCMPARGLAFVHALGPGTARYALLRRGPRAQAGWMARASAWIQAATRRTSSRGAGSACSSQ